MHVLKENSFCTFTLPFIFESEQLQQRAESFDGNTMKSYWKSHQFNDDELVEGVLANECSDEELDPDIRVWRLSNEGLRDWSGLGAEWKLLIKKGKPGEKKIQFDFQSVALSMFSTGVCFLSLKVSLKSNSYSDWIDFMHYFRFSDRPKLASLHGIRKLPQKAYDHFSKSKQSPDAPEVREPLGFEFEGTLHERIYLLLANENDRQKWWKTTYVSGQLVPFFCLLTDECDDVSAYQELYQLRNFFHSNSYLAPSKSDLAENHAGIREYCESQWFVFSRDGGGYYSRNPPNHPFFKQTICDHVSDHYFLMFLLVLHQRFHISTNLKNIAVEWGRKSASRGHEALERLKEIDLWYSSRFQLGQIAQNDHHQSFYNKWQETFSIRSEFNELKHKVNETQLSVYSDRQRRIENRINLFGALLGLPALVASVMSVNVIGLSANEGWHCNDFKIAIGLSIVAGFLWFYCFLRH